MYREQDNSGSWVVKIPLEEEVATHSSILARIIPQTKKPGGLQSVGSQRVRHDCACVHTCTHTHTPTRLYKLGESCSMIISSITEQEDCYKMKLESLKANFLISKFAEGQPYVS